MLHDENVSIFCIHEKKWQARLLFFFSLYVHVISILFLNTNNKVLAFFVTFPSLIFVTLCVVLSFHHAALVACSIFMEISLP